MPEIYAALIFLAVFAFGVGFWIGFWKGWKSAAQRSCRWPAEECQRFDKMMQLQKPEK